MNVASFDELQDKYRLVFLAMPRTQTLRRDGLPPGAVAVNSRGNIEETHSLPLPVSARCSL